MEKLAKIMGKDMQNTVNSNLIPVLYCARSSRSRNRHLKFLSCLFVTNNLLFSMLDRARRDQPMWAESTFVLILSYKYNVQLASPPKQATKIRISRGLDKTRTRTNDPRKKMHGCVTSRIKVPFS